MNMFSRALESESLDLRLALPLADKPERTTGPCQDVRREAEGRSTFCTSPEKEVLLQAQTNNLNLTVSSTSLKPIRVRNFASKASQLTDFRDEFSSINHDSDPTPCGMPPTCSTSLEALTAERLYDSPELYEDPLWALCRSFEPLLYLPGRLGKGKVGGWQDYRIVNGECRYDYERYENARHGYQVDEHFIDQKENKDLYDSLTALNNVAWFNMDGEVVNFARTLLYWADRYAVWKSFDDPGLDIILSKTDFAILIYSRRKGSPAEITKLVNMQLELFRALVEFFSSIKEHQKLLFFNNTYLNRVRFYISPSRKFKLRLRPRLIWEVTFTRVPTNAFDTTGFADSVKQVINGLGMNSAYWYSEMRQFTTTFDDGTENVETIYLIYFHSTFHHAFRLLPVPDTEDRPMLPPADYHGRFHLTLAAPNDPIITLLRMQGGGEGFHPRYIYSELLWPLEEQSNIQDNTLWIVRLLFSHLRLVRTTAVDDEGTRDYEWNSPRNCSWHEASRLGYKTSLVSDYAVEDPIYGSHYVNRVRRFFELLEVDHPNPLECFI